MKTQMPKSINTPFIIALALGLGGILVSIATAGMAMPVTSWFALIVGVIGIMALLALIVVAIGSEVTTFLLNRPDNLVGE